MAGIEFVGQAAESGGLAIYNNPLCVAPADRLYAKDVDVDGFPDTYNPADYADEPGAAARANGYPRLS
jgi:hypothetical protein